MLLLGTDKLPDGPAWRYELKLDGYRALAIKSSGTVRLVSRHNNDFTALYSGVAKALSKMPDDTVLDGEVVALDQSGRPDFNTLQNYGASSARIVYFVFDVPILKGRDLASEPLTRRVELLETTVMPQLAEPVRLSPAFEVSLADLVESVRAQGLEGIVAKRRDSRYEPGQRSGAWQKLRINRGQGFVIGGYVPSGRNFDSLIFGYYDDQGQLRFAAKTRNGFTPASRNQVFKRLQSVPTGTCPFVNLPEKKPGRWSQGITAEKIGECVWLEPKQVRDRHVSPSSWHPFCKSPGHNAAGGSAHTPRP
jgi:bifunctional non-homologous end joining protein LigD